MDLNVFIVPSVEIELENEEITKLEQDVRALVEWPKWVQKSLVNKIKLLNCFENVRSMLINGVPSIETARYIQQVGELRDIELDSVRQYVEHFKATLPRGYFVAQVDQRKYTDTVKKFDGGHRTLKRLDAIYDILMERIETGRKVERMTGFLVANLDKPIEQVTRLIKDMHEIEEKVLGVGPGQSMAIEDPSQRRINQVDFDKLYDKQGLNAVVRDPQSRLRVVKFVDSAMQYFKNLKEEEANQVIEVVARKVDSAKAAKKFEVVEEESTEEKPEDPNKSDS